MEYETRILVRSLLVVLPLFVIVSRLIFVLPSVNSPVINDRADGAELPSWLSGSNIMIFLGSGGHTGEMMSILSKVNLTQLNRIWVVSSNDSTSILKCKEYEDTLKTNTAPSFISLLRARDVGEPLLSSLKSTIRSFIDTFLKLRQLPQLPDVLLVNGPGTSVPIAYMLFLFRFLGVGNTRIVYIESLARVNDLSLSGKLLLPITDRFIVQWPAVANRYKRAEYYGCINLNVIDFVGCLLPVDMKTLTDKGKQGIQVVDYTTKGNAIVRYRGRTWIQVNNELLPSEIKLVFSRHSSYSECKEFVKTFNPVSVYPCVTSKGTWENGFVMSRLFKDVCVSGGIENFAFDVINCATHGIPISPIMVRPVKTINRWDLQDCENELRFVAKYFESYQDFKFFSQVSFSEPEARTTKEKKTVTLAQIISNRNDSSFKHFMKQSEYLYEKYIKSSLPGQVPCKVDYLDELNRLGLHESCSYSSIEDLDYYTRVSISFPSSDSGQIRTENEIFDEFGRSVRTPTLRNEANVTSSFDSIEVSCKHAGQPKDLDDANINRIARQLREDPDSYFSMHLKCTSKS
ncbi:UDP-N-acetylglucosamine transferase subunit [Yamadazyma tenuis]|uniref:UDP-N-acetylglucosamine transferase subunit n=1 Tax=Candida tenuis TaxID=2315449 RepID=UPI0027A98528|nr:UDP-N-acetylglucosamine transferase subunit [Yamadazyma tenuis]